MLTSLRVAASGVVTALAALITVYPHDTWIPAVLAAASAVGIHAIPAISTGGTTVSTPTGPELMGIAKPASNTSSTTEESVNTSSNPDPANTVPAATESATTEASTVATDVETAVSDTAAAEPAVKEAIPGVTEAVQSVRDAFESLLKLVSGHI